MNSVISIGVFFCFSILFSFSFFSISDEAQLSSPEEPPTKARNTSWHNVDYIPCYLCVSVYAWLCPCTEMIRFSTLLQIFYCFLISTLPPPLECCFSEGTPTPVSVPIVKVAFQALAWSRLIAHASELCSLLSHLNITLNIIT